MNRKIKGNRALVAAAISAMASQAANGVEIPIEKEYIETEIKNFTLDLLKTDNALVQEAGVFSSHIVLDDAPITGEEVLLAIGPTDWQSFTGEGVYDINDGSPASVTSGQDSNLYHIIDEASKDGSAYDLELKGNAEWCHAACHINCHSSRSWR